MQGEELGPAVDLQALLADHEILEPECLGLTTSRRVAPSSLNSARTSLGAVFGSEVMWLVLFEIDELKLEIGADPCLDLFRTAVDDSLLAGLEAQPGDDAIAQFVGRDAEVFRGGGECLDGGLADVLVLGPVADRGRINREQGGVSAEQGECLDRVFGHLAATAFSPLSDLLV